jgi:three-Cys-motif partner protein
MSDLPFKFDEISYWSELKLEIVEKYGTAYTTAFKKSRLKKYYIDGFSGAGVHVSKHSGERIEGSPTRALRVKPPFDGFYFIDLDSSKTDYLRGLCADKADVHIHTGDANQQLRELLPTIDYAKYNRALCLLDPYALQLDWEIMYLAGQSKAVDMFLNFPVMDMNRNAIWRNPEKVPQSGVERMTKFWGDESWKQAAYAESRQGGLFGPEMVKQSNEDIVASFQDRLKTIAGFQYVPEPLPMRNRRNAVVYYLFFASQKPVAQRIISDIFGKYKTARRSGR